MPVSTQGGVRMQNVRTLVTGCVVLASLLAGLVWVIVLLVKHAFGEALLVCYFVLAALLTLVAVAGVVAAMQQSLMLNLFKSLLLATKGLLKVRLFLMMLLNVATGLLNWPAMALVEARRYNNKADFRTQLGTLTGFSVHQYVYAGFNCLLAVLLALRARGSMDGPLRVALLLVLLSVMLRHLTLLVMPGGAMSFVKRGRVHPLVSYVMLALLDLVTLVLVDAVWGKWYAAKQLSLAVLRPTMTSFLASPKHLVDAVSNIAATGVAGLKLTGSTRHDELILLAGLLYYGSLARVVSGGFSTFDRSDDDQIAVAAQHLAEGEYKESLATLALLKSNSLQAEQVRAQAMLALGDLKGAQASVRRRMILDPAVDFEPTVTDVFADLFEKAWVYNQTRPELWDEAIKAKASQGMLAMILLSELGLSLAGTQEKVSLREESMERASLVYGCALCFQHELQECLTILAGVAPVDASETYTLETVKRVAELRLIEDVAARREAVTAWLKADGDAYRARALELIAGKAWERGTVAAYGGFLAGYLNNLDPEAEQWAGAIWTEAKRVTELAVPSSGDVAKFLMKKMQDGVAAGQETQGAMPPAVQS